MQTWKTDPSIWNEILGTAQRTRAGGALLDLVDRAHDKAQFSPWDLDHSALALPSCTGTYLFSCRQPFLRWSCCLLSLFHIASSFVNTTIHILPLDYFLIHAQFDIANDSSMEWYLRLVRRGAPCAGNDPEFLRSALLINGEIVQAGYSVRLGCCPRDQLSRSRGCSNLSTALYLCSKISYTSLTARTKLNSLCTFSARQCHSLYD